MARCGERVPVHVVGQGAWEVPRVWIALHGLPATEIAALADEGTLPVDGSLCSDDRETEVVYHAGSVALVNGFWACHLCGVTSEPGPRVGGTPS